MLEYLTLVSYRCSVDIVAATPSLYSIGGVAYSRSCYNLFANYDGGFADFLRNCCCCSTNSEVALACYCIATINLVQLSPPSRRCDAAYLVTVATIARSSQSSCWCDGLSQLSQPHPWLSRSGDFSQIPPFTFDMSHIPLFVVRMSKSRDLFLICHKHTTFWRVSPRLRGQPANVSEAIC
jgi:hypothetical protein